MIIIIIKNKLKVQKLLLEQSWKGYFCSKIQRVGER